MDERNYTLRMVAHHQGEKNEIADLTLEMLVEEEWQVVEVDMAASSPYRVFLYTVFLCQNSYLYMNAAERGILLETTSGEIRLHTEDFRIVSAKASFESTMRAGDPTQEDVEYICGRMTVCPVSRNLVRIPDASVELQLD